MPAPFGEINRARRQRFRMKGQPQDVEGLPEQALRNALQQRRHHAVGRDQIPVAVIGERRIGFMRLEDKIDRPARRLQRRIVKFTLRKGRRVACGD
jgi:hypothetical protein